MTSTTIEVPKALRDRLADRARVQGTTMAAAIERALDESDEQRFWEAVRREHEALSNADREAYRSSGGQDDLADASDDAISERGGWQTAETSSSRTSASRSVTSRRSGAR